MKKTRDFLTAVLAAVIGLTACGGGGDGGSPPPSQPPVVTISRLTLTQQGEIVTAAVTETVSVAKAMLDCPEKTGAVCTKPGLIGTLSFDSTVPFENLKVVHNGQEVLGTFAGYTFTPANPWSFSGPGTVEVKGKVAPTAMPGSSATITLRATGAGGTVVDVSGNPTLLAVNKPLEAVTVSFSNATAGTFTQLGYGEIGAFDLTCPKEVNGGCSVTMRHTFQGSIPAKSVVDTLVGTAWWYSSETTNTTTSANEVLNLVSPYAVPSGMTVHVAIRSKNVSGSITVEVFAKDRTGKDLNTPPCAICPKG